MQYLDAPISGSSQQTRDGKVTTIVGGKRESFDACRDLFDCWSAKTIYAGPCGSGSKMKLVSNLVLGLNRAALAEGLVFAETLGLETNAALEVLISSMSYSRIMDTKGKKMIESDFRAQARLAQHLKDIRLILDAASQAGQDLPLSEVHAQLLEAGVAAGLGDEDNSAIIQSIRRCKNLAFGVYRGGKLMLLAVGTPALHWLDVAVVIAYLSASPQWACGWGATSRGSPSTSCLGVLARA